MRVEEFKEWARTQNYAESTVRTFASDSKRVEREENIDLDEEFEKDELKSLIRLYTPTAQDERDGNIPEMKIVTKHKDKSLSESFSGYRVTLNQYRKFCLSDGDYSVSVEPESESSTDEGATFGLERDMQEAMRETITQLESGLEIIDGGVERKVDSGFIDILAKDSNGAFVVIELKAGKASDSVIAQTLGYMVDIADAEGLEINQVRGIIVAKSFNKRIETAARAVPSLTLKAYTYSFDFN